MVVLSNERSVFLFSCSLVFRSLRFASSHTLRILCNWPPLIFMTASWICKHASDASFKHCCSNEDVACVLELSKAAIAILYSCLTLSSTPCSVLSSETSAAHVRGMFPDEEVESMSTLNKNCRLPMSMKMKRCWLSMWKGLDHGEHGNLGQTWLWDTQKNWGK